MAYCAYVLYIKNTLATRKLARIPFMCTLIEELCGQELILDPIGPWFHKVTKLKNCLTERRRTVSFAPTELLWVEGDPKPNALGVRWVYI